MLTEKQRLEKIFRQEHVDRPPCICPGGMMNMITMELMQECGVTWPDAHLDAEQMAKLAMAAYERDCFENIGVPFCMTVEAEELGAEITLGTNVFEPHVVKYAIESVVDWEKLKPIDVHAGRAKVVLDAIEIIKKRNKTVPIIGNLAGPVSVASSVMEPVHFYKELRKRNEIAHQYMTFITDQILAFAEAQIKAGVDVIAISDPSGTGEILGPKFFDEFVVKYMNILLDGIKKHNVRTIVHICGQMKSVYKELSKIRSDALSFDSIVSIADAKKNLPGRVIMGNVSTYALEFAQPEKIASLTKYCVKNGANIISPACGLGTRSPLKNVRAILDELKHLEGEGGL